MFFRAIWDKLSAILRQERNDNTSWLVSIKKETWKDGNYKERAITK